MLKGYIYQGGARNSLKINFKGSKLIYPNINVNINDDIKLTDCNLLKINSVRLKLISI